MMGSVRGAGLGWRAPASRAAALRASSWMREPSRRPSSAPDSSFPLTSTTRSSRPIRRCPERGPALGRIASSMRCIRIGCSFDSPSRENASTDPPSIAPTSTPRFSRVRAVSRSSRVRSRQAPRITASIADASAQRRMSRSGRPKTGLGRKHLIWSAPTVEKRMRSSERGPERDSKGAALSGNETSSARPPGITRLASPIRSNRACWRCWTRSSCGSDALMPCLRAALRRGSDPP